MDDVLPIEEAKTLTDNPDATDEAIAQVPGAQRRRLAVAPGPSNPTDTSAGREEEHRRRSHAAGRTRSATTSCRSSPASAPARCSSSSPSGLTLVFGALRVVNFAHGSLYMIGAYVAISLAAGSASATRSSGSSCSSPPSSSRPGGLFMEMLFFRPIYRRPLLTQLLVTFAFVLIIAGIDPQGLGAAKRDRRRPALPPRRRRRARRRDPEVPVLLHGRAPSSSRSCSGRSSTRRGSAARSAPRSPTPCCSVFRA